MIFQTFQPSPALSLLVKNYLVVNIWGDSAYLPLTPYPARIEQALVFFARGYIESFDHDTNTSARIANNAVFAQQTARLTFQSIAQEDFLMVMVVFQPGGMFRMLGMPMQEITGNFFDAEHILSAELRRVNDNIANCKSYAAMIERVEDYLLRKSRSLRISAHPADAIARCLLNDPSAYSLDWLARQANLSPRQLERVFNERAGVGPKLYARISRFFNAFLFKDTHADADWLTVALQFGYNDYNHMAKDFRQFAHVSPNVMLHEYASRAETLVLQNR